MIEIELIVGTMGIDQILSGKLPRFSKALLDRAGTALTAFRQGADTFAAANKSGNLPNMPLHLKDYDDISKKLLANVEMLSVESGLGSWPSDLQTPVVVQLADVRMYLTQQLPGTQNTGFFAADQLPPSDSDQFRFLWQANLVNDIREFIGLLNAGAITPIESALMRTLFPETHDYLLVELMDKVLDTAVAGKLGTWEGSWRKPAMAAFVGVPIESFSDIMQAQTGMAEKTAGRSKGPGSVQIAKFNLSDNQKIDTRTIDMSKGS